jgi:hypothetical protein
VLPRLRIAWAGFFISGAQIHGSQEDGPAGVRPKGIKGGVDSGGDEYCEFQIPCLLQLREGLIEFTEGTVGVCGKEGGKRRSAPLQTCEQSMRLFAVACEGGHVGEHMFPNGVGISPEELFEQGNGVSEASRAGEDDSAHGLRHSKMRIDFKSATELEFGLLPVMLVVKHEAVTVIDGCHQGLEIAADAGEFHGFRQPAGSRERLAAGVAGDARIRI